MKLDLTPNAIPWPDTSTTERRAIVDGSGTGIAVGFGVGIDIFPVEAVFFGLEWRANYLGSTSYGVTATGRNAGFTEAKNDLSVSQIFLRGGVKFGR